MQRNALRAGLVEEAAAWRWSRLWRWLHPQVTADVPPLANWPLPAAMLTAAGRPRAWRACVNRPQSQAEQDAIRHALARGVPLASDRWRARMIDRHGLHTTITPRGRPRIRPNKGS